MALYLPRSQALFLHIPKTGGTWIETALERSQVLTQRPPQRRDVSIRHALPQHIHVDPRHVFAFVRHPLRWYESWWKFQAGTWHRFEPSVWHPQRCLEPCASDRFMEFVSSCAQQEPAYVTRMYEWYLGPAHSPRRVLVGRHENLADDLVRILEEIDEDFDEKALRSVAPINVSRCRRGVPEWADSALKERVESYEAAFVRRFYSDRPR